VRRRNEAECSQRRITGNLSTVKPYLLDIAFERDARGWAEQSRRGADPSFAKNKPAKGRPPRVSVGQGCATRPPSGRTSYLLILLGRPDDDVPHLRC
jgi:hypothetical protein